ncbi:YbaB/EbfC family nucleoid-associated protein [Nonomuraea sp. ATR24]|uniref:YbaB/EbfC family nucleoid-associated protein n=1 Tax=Nonomuraea TaxID=83681 RepID=UPI001C5D8D90|nr:YbaB/EbfC family nucleoid-associated protein [Nonomuraea ceibae]
MSELNFDSLDVDQVIRNADLQMGRVAELQQEMAKVVGRAEDEDGLVKVEIGGPGLQELHLHPKAMRLTSGELAERIKETIAAATADHRRQMTEAMEALFGAENPLRFADDPEGALEQARQAEAVYNKTFEDVMGELARIHQRVEE